MGREAEAAAGLGHLQPGEPPAPLPWGVTSPRATSGPFWTESLCSCNITGVVGIHPLLSCVFLLGFVPPPSFRTGLEPFQIWGVFKPLLPLRKNKRKSGSCFRQCPALPWGAPRVLPSCPLLVFPPRVPPSCPPLVSWGAHPSQLCPPLVPPPHSGSALTCQDLPSDLPNPQIRALKGQKEGGEMELGSSGETHVGMDPSCPPILPRDSFSNILCVFLVKIIPEPLLWGGWEGGCRDFGNLGFRGSIHSALAHR